MYESNDERNYEEENKKDQVYREQNGNNYYQWQQSQPYVKPVKPKKEKKFGKKLVAGAVIGLVFGMTAAGSYQGISYLFSYFKPATSNEASIGAAGEQESVPAQAQITVPSVEIAPEQSADTQVAQNAKGTYSVSEIAQICMPSVVSITNKSVTEFQSWFGPMQQENVSAGSGIIVGQNDSELLIATNNHVVDGAVELSVCFNDNVEQVYPALAKGTDKSNDLAIIAIELKDIPAEVLSEIRVAELGDSEELVVGEQVVAIGNALGYGQSVTSGYVSALDRTIDVGDTSVAFIQTDAAINPGNSGGALFNMRGQVIGINSAKLANSMIEGMGYAIPISTALPILNDLEDRVTRTKVEAGTEGILGISCQNVSEEASKLYGIPKGVYIGEVNEGGAAEKAGIRKADVLIKFDGLNISSVAELKSTLQYYKAGETVNIVVSRMGDEGYNEVTLTITLDAKAQQ